MNGNRPASPATSMREFAQRPSPFEHYKAEGGYQGAPKGMHTASLSAARRGSGSFVIESADVKTGEVAALDKDRLGGTYGVSSAAPNSTPMTPLGGTSN
jgi:hypothetical protein